MDMKKKKTAKTAAAGFSLLELIIVIAILAIIMGIALPEFAAWRQSAKYKQAADGVLSALRTARHNAVTQNIQNRVEFNPVGNRYRITQGDRAYNSSTWATVKQDWTTLPSEVVMMTGNCTTNNDLNVPFSPDGSASAGTICIDDSNNSNKYRVVVSASGRIQNVKP